MNKDANGDEYTFRTPEDWGTITGVLVPSKDSGVEYRKIDPESGELKITQSKMFTHPDGTEFKSAKELLDYVDTLKLRQRMAKEERDMPCFFCKAFGDDEQCLINRHSVSREGIEGLDCPRIKKAIDEQK